MVTHIIIIIASYPVPSLRHVHALYSRLHTYNVMHCLKVAICKMALRSHVCDNVNYVNSLTPCRVNNNITSVHEDQY